MKKLTARDVEVVRQGAKLVVPENLSARELVEVAERFCRDEEQEIALHAEIEEYPIDALVCLHKVLAERYGLTTMVPTPGWFVDEPPIMVRIQTGVDEGVQVGYGRISIPGMEGYLDVRFKMYPKPALIIAGVIRNKNKREVDEIVEDTKRRIRADSIYKGRAISLDFSWRREGDDFDPLYHAPKFWNVGEKGQDALILGRQVDDAMQHGLWSFVQYSDVFRREGIPLKRGVLLEGPFGVGKTLSARVTAQLCEEHGWTFIHLSDVRDLAEALIFASHYAPAVLFAEDVDQVVQGGRSAELNELLNVLDGVESKGKEIITVLTTNQLDVINPAVLRPGRIDSVISLKAPDADAAERLVRHYGGSMIAIDEPLEGVGRALAGKIPAVIREVVESAKAVAITRLMKEGIKPEALSAGGQVTAIDLLKSGELIEMHNSLITREQPKAQTVADRVSNAFVETILKGNMEGVRRVATLMDGNHANGNTAAAEYAEATAKE